MVTGGHTWLPGDICGCGGRGHAWLWGACVVAREACMVARGHARMWGGHVWLQGALHGCEGACMVGCRGVHGGGEGV